MYIFYVHIYFMHIFHAYDVNSCPKMVGKLSCLLLKIEIADKNIHILFVILFFILIIFHIRH